MAAPSLATLSLSSSCPVADEVLVERVRSGDQGAFGEMYERYFARVYHFVARRLRNRADRLGPDACACARPQRRARRRDAAVP